MTSDGHWHQTGIATHRQRRKRDNARIPESFDHPDCLFELKHDGFRALAPASRSASEMRLRVIR